MSEQFWRSALLAAACFAVCPSATGIALRSRAGPVRDCWMRIVKTLVVDAGANRKNGCVWRTMPLGVSDDRLVGGLDLATTLSRGKPVFQPGLLAQATGGVLVVSMAERLSGQHLGCLTRAMDSHNVVIEREGFSRVLDANFGVLALDESCDEGEALMPALADRLALHVNLGTISVGVSQSDESLYTVDDIANAKTQLQHVKVPDDAIQCLCEVALNLGVDSFRANMASVTVARISAALSGREVVEECDIQAAVMLCTAPRATRLPASDEQSSEEQADSPPPPESSPEANQPDGSSNFDQLPDQLVESSLAYLPQNLLDQTIPMGRAAAASTTSGRSGQRQRSQQRGRPIGVRASRELRGQRLSLVDTLRAAAPWQRIRGAAEALPAGTSRVAIRAEDFRVKRFEERTSRTVIFAVDASGSHAMARLGEAKGAIEMLLADCYVRRDTVAVVAFRGGGAQTLLPPTGSLAMARKRLAHLPGGGGTPLASGLVEAHGIALSQRRLGETPMIVLLTDGKANVTLEGIGGRKGAREDVEHVARLIARDQVELVVVDTSLRSTPQAVALAKAAHAKYVALPSAGAAKIDQVVRQSLAV